MSVSDQIRSMILDGDHADKIRRCAIQEGMVPLIRDGMMKVKHNITTPSEVLRNAYATD